MGFYISSALISIFYSASVVCFSRDLEYLQRVPAVNGNQNSQTDYQIWLPHNVEAPVIFQLLAFLTSFGLTKSAVYGVLFYVNAWKCCYSADLHFPCGRCEIQQNSFQRCGHLVLQFCNWNANNWYVMSFPVLASEVHRPRPNSATGCQVQGHKRVENCVLVCAVYK